MHVFKTPVHQPVGSYFIGNPQSNPIPATSLNNASDYPGGAGMVVMPGASSAAGGFNLMPMLLIGGVVVAGWFFLRR